MFKKAVPSVLTIAMEESVREEQGEKEGQPAQEKNKFTSNITPYNAKTVYLSVYLPVSHLTPPLITHGYTSKGSLGSASGLTSSSGAQEAKRAAHQMPHES